MIYIHYCNHCDSIRMLSGHKTLCPACQSPIRELPITYTQYATLSASQRETLLSQVRRTDP